MPGKKKTRKPARLPVPRGRRGHKAVDEQPGLQEWLRERLMQPPQPTLAQIMEELKSTGFSIGRTAVWEFKVRCEVEKARLANTIALAKSYNQAADDGEVLDVETAIANFTNSKLFEELLAKAGQSTGLTIGEVIAAFTRMQSSSSMRERTKFAIDRGARRTASRIKRETQELLQKHPELLKAMLRVIDAAAAEVQR